MAEPSGRASKLENAQFRHLRQGLEEVEEEFVVARDGGWIIHVFFCSSAEVSFFVVAALNLLASEADATEHLVEIATQMADGA